MTTYPRQYFSIQRPENSPPIGTWSRPDTASRNFVLVRAYMDETATRPIYDERQHSEHDWRFITENKTQREWEVEQGIREPEIFDRSR